MWKPALSTHTHWQQQTMNLLKLKHNLHHHHHHFSRRNDHTPSYLVFTPKRLNLSSSLYYPFTSYYVKSCSNINAANPLSYSIENYEKEKEIEIEIEEEYLAEDGEVYQKTLRLVECAMFAAVSGLAFLLSTSLAIEKYFACFFSLPIVLSTMRWDIAAGRKTMVATSVLLFVLSGPVKALTYLLLHGLPGLAMGTLWRLKTRWGPSVLLCSIVRAAGAMCNIVIVSYLIGENILGLITINAHAAVTYILASLGAVAVPSMNFIYFIFGFLLMLNCGSYMFLLHVLYAIFFTRLGMKASIRLPKWLEAAM